jgi:ABC-2 type transport system ATP-binding protein
MKELVLKTKNITKHYKDKVAVDRVNITIEKGDIYGLIGRNGAGKTTLIRMITSLTSIDSGEIELFGEVDQGKLNICRKRIGAVIETPALYPNLSAKENLEYYRILKGIPKKKAVEEVLKIVGLSDVGKKKFKNFSLGMKQRLGIALALLNNPDFIILDEPINGLDPMGIVELRETFKRLNEEYGITLLISSHILNELSLIANRYGIINNGKLINELTSDELNEKCQRCLHIKVDNMAKTVGILETELNTTKYKVINDNELRVYDYLHDPSEVTLKLVTQGIRLYTIKEVGDTLEQYFISLVGEDK